MTFKTIAVIGAGDMGHAVGAALVAQGYDVVTCLAGRSAITRTRAARAGLRDLPDLDAVVAACDAFLSILPPALAPELAEAVVAAMRRTGNRPLYADLNAISPATATGIAATIEGAGAKFVDGGIVGSPPGKAVPRIYLSGRDAEAVAAVAALGGAAMDMRPCGAEPGRASAVKMCYAALTKGSNALFAAVLTAAEALGVSPEVRGEYETSQPDLYRRMKASVPFLPADAWRYAGEMEEIAATFESVGVTPLFHLGAAATYRLLDTTPFAKETRETLDRSRTLEQAIEAYAHALKSGEKIPAE
jgi:3-hydroxyisobutyrate dehydrogenase-like beta-hydroxyacid dehydrogenase